MVLDPEKVKVENKDNEIHDRAQAFALCSDIMHKLPNGNVLFVSYPVKCKQLLRFLRSQGSKTYNKERSKAS